MAVAFDAVAPGATGTGSTGAQTLSWTHTVTGANTAVLVGCCFDNSADGGMSLTATCGGTSMASLGVVHTGGSTLGFLQVFGLATGSGGSKSIVVTAAGGTPNDLNGGSLSFTGASQAAPFGTAVTASGNSATASAATAGSTSGNMVAGFAGTGTGITSATAPSTSRFIENYVGGAGAGAGDSAGATSSSTGSAVTMAWTVSADIWAAIVVEVLAAGAATSATAGIASGTGTAPGASVAGLGLVTPVAHATAVAILAGGYGTWGTPEYAEGGP